MKRRTDSTEIRRTKLFTVGATSIALFLPLILAAAFLNMGQGGCGGGGGGPPPPPPDFRVSITSDGVAGDANSCCGSASAQGNHIAFRSVATNLNPGTSQVSNRQLFVHNRVTKETTWVSLGALGHSNSEGVSSQDLSDDGRYIAFSERFYRSTKSIIFRDLAAEPATFETLFSTSRIGSSVGGVTMSGDGRYVAFSTNEPFPFGIDTNGESDVFIRDRQDMSLTRASLGPGGTEYAKNAGSPRLSRDGVWIAFTLNNRSSTLAQVDLEIVVQRVDGTGPSYRFDGRKPSISDDGSLIAYEVQAGPYDNDTIFLFDRIAGTHEQVSVDYAGRPSFGRCENPVISGDGRYVAFNCLQTMIYKLGSGLSNKIYVRDVISKTTKMASVNPDGEPANNIWSTDTAALSMPANGNALIFSSDADNLGDVPGGFRQLFRVPRSYWLPGDAECEDDAIDPQTQAALTVSAFELVRMERQTSGKFDYTYAATLLNNRGVRVPEARAIVSTSDLAASVPDAELEFGFVAAGESARSTGTFTIRQNENSCFKPSSLSFALTTPPEFDPPVPRGVQLGSTELIQLTASDPEGDPLSFLAATPPAGVTLNAATGNLTVVATGAPRSFPVYVNVSDGVFEDSTAIDIALYAPGVVSPPAPQPDLSIPPEVQASLPETTDGRLVLSVSTETGIPDAPTVALVYDPTADGPVARWGACLSRVVACARTNNIGTFPGCVPMIERCPDDTGGMDCCAPSCIDTFTALAGSGMPVMQAINDSFLDGHCQEGLR